MADRRPIGARNTGAAARAAAVLVRAGATPNAISALSVAFAVAAGALLAAPWGPLAWLLAGVAIQGRLLCNLFDGMVAVEGGRQSVTGELWNDFPDRLSDTAIFVGAGYGAGAPELGWVAAIAALHVAYARVLGRAAGAPSRFEGPMAKQHRMALLTVACVAAVFFGPPAIVGALAAVVAGCVVTVVRRLRLVAGDLQAAR